MTTRCIPLLAQARRARPRPTGPGAPGDALTPSVRCAATVPVAPHQRRGGPPTRGGAATGATGGTTMLTGLVIGLAAGLAWPSGCLASVSSCCGRPRSGPGADRPGRRPRPVPVGADDLKRQMAGEFAQLSAEALQRNADQFLQLADTRLGESRTAAADDLARRQEAIEHLLTPIAEQLGRYDEGMQPPRTRAVAVVHRSHRADEAPRRLPRPAAEGDPKPGHGPAQPRRHADDGGSCSSGGSWRWPACWSAVTSRSR